MRLHDCLTRAAGIWPGRLDLTGRTLRNGWLRTEDVGCLDGDGHLFVVGAIVYPADTENAPYRCGNVTEVAVARENQRSGQLVHVLTASAARERPDPAEITALGQDHRADCAHPRSAGIRGVLTMTSAGKVGTRLLPEGATPHA
jgi:acyl-CoA synthetase (AMP-forming)/AMP-acid ligase II